MVFQGSPKFVIFLKGITWNKIVLLTSLRRSHHSIHINTSLTWRRALHDYEQGNHPATFRAKVWDVMHCQGKPMRQAVRGISRILDRFQKGWVNHPFLTFWAKNVRKIILPEPLIWSERWGINHLKIKPRKGCQKQSQIWEVPNRWNLAQKWLSIH